MPIVARALDAAHPAPAASTPGPWVIWKSHADASVNVAQAGTHAFVCTVGRPTAPNVLGDARLITAAPDLLAALKAILHTYDEGGVPLGHAFEMANAAIAKVGTP